MIPSPSPRRTSKLTPSSTWRRSNRRGSNTPRRCSRTVSRCTLGIQNAFDTASTSMSDMAVLHVFRSAWAQQTKDDHPGQQAERRIARQIQVPPCRGHDAGDERGAREFDDWRRRPHIQVEVKTLGEDPEWIDDGREEESCLEHHIPDLIEIAIA